MGKAPVQVFAPTTYREIFTKTTSGQSGTNATKSCATARGQKPLNAPIANHSKIAKATDCTFANKKTAGCFAVIWRWWNVGFPDLDNASPATFFCVICVLKEF